MKKTGFTLIELVMVIVIIGILAAVAIPRFIDLRNEARRAVCQSDVGAIRTGLANWYAQYNINNNTCPGGAGACNATSGFPVEAQLSNATSVFGRDYFSDGVLPNAGDITNDAGGNWSDYYNELTGVINISDCCS